jgi:hypothetical protein
MYHPAHLHQVVVRQVRLLHVVPHDAVREAVGCRAEIDRVESVFHL